MNKVLIVSYNYPPDQSPGAIRVSKFAWYLPDFGWQPTIIAPKTFYTSAGGHGSPKESSATEVIRPKNWDWGFLASRFLGKGGSSPRKESRRWLGGIGAGLHRAARWCADNFLFVPDRANLWYFASIRAGREVLRNGQVRVIFSSSPFITDHLACWRLHSACGIPWVADFRDPWTPLGEYSTGLRRRVDEYLESRIMRRATHVTLVTRQMKDLYLRLYPFLESKSTVLPNGYDAEDFRALQRTRGDDFFRMVYCGSFYHGIRNPEPLLASLSRLLANGSLDRDKVQLRIVGPRETFLEELIAKYKLTASTLLTGSLPHRQSLQEMVDADLLWLVTGDFACADVFHSSKLFEYLAANVPILAFSPAGGAAATLIRELGAGSVAPDEAEKLDQLVKLFYVNRGRPRDRAFRDRLAVYERRNLAEQLAKLFDLVSS